MGTTYSILDQKESSDEILVPSIDLQPEKQSTDKTKSTTIPKARPKQTIEIYIPEKIYSETQGTIRKEFSKFKKDFTVDLMKLSSYEYTPNRDGVHRVCICTFDTDLKQIKEAPLPKPHVAVCLLILRRGVGNKLEEEKNKDDKIGNQLKNQYGGVINFVHTLRSTSQGDIDDSAYNMQARKDLENFILKGQIQIYCRAQGTVQSQPTIPIPLLSNVKKRIKVMYAANYICYTVDHPDKLYCDEPVIAVCIEKLRVMADVKTAVKDINEEKFGMHCVVYLHPREKNALRNETTLRNRDVTNDIYLNKFACFLDCVYNKNFDIYECDINKHADEQLNHYIDTTDRAAMQIQLNYSSQEQQDISGEHGVVRGDYAGELPKKEHSDLKNTSEEPEAVEEESILLPDDKPWRAIGNITMDANGFTKLLEEIKDLRPDDAVKQLNIAVIGRVQAGKSSFINTILSAFVGHVASRVETGSDPLSVTKKYTMYTVPSRGHGAGFQHFRMCDTRGMVNESDKKYGLESKNFLYLLKGNIKQGYQFDIHGIISKRNDYFLEEPGLQDEIHCLCIVLNGSTTDNLPTDSYPTIATFLKKIESTHGLRYVILLTHMDIVCSAVAEDPSRMYHSVKVGRRVAKVANKLKIHQRKIKPIVNYNYQFATETETDVSINILALLALRQLLRVGNEVLDNRLHCE